MRWFFLAVGILAWLVALGVVWIFSESGGALNFIAAGVFETVAILGLVGERIIKTLEEIRDGSVTRIRVNAAPERAVTRAPSQSDPKSRAQATRIRISLRRPTSPVRRRPARVDRTSTSATMQRGSSRSLARAPS